MTQNPHISPTGSHRAKHPQNVHVYCLASLLAWRFTWTFSLARFVQAINQRKYALSIKWACTIYLTASLQLRQLLFSPFRAYLVNQGCNPVRYGYLLLLCNTMLNKSTFLFKNLVYNWYYLYLCIRLLNHLKIITMTLKKLLALIDAHSERTKTIATAYCKAGINDCRCGLYNQWFSFHRYDKVFAYDIGWKYANKTVKN